MKNLTKLFFAVVAGMFAFSCVTDTTEDLGVNIDGQKGGVYEVAISLAEATKTQLGEKVDGLYPLYWSEGDAIAINGIVSDPLAEGGSDAATFKFGTAVNRPYCVVYPAPTAATVEDEVVEEPVAPVTVYPVTFAATQPYTVGTFAPGVAPMYGYAVEPAEDEEEAPIQLNHLTGVLRFSVKGNGEKVTSMRVVAEKGKIAGPFTVDCTNGALTALDEATNAVTVTFDGGLVLGSEAQEIYVAVPSGSYGTFLVTLVTEAHNKMTVKFNSNVKPIKVGTVREFSEFTYQENSSDTEEGEYLIDSAEALINFAKIASSFYPRTSVKVVADIDMTGIEWTPINYFGEYDFDGGSDMGYSIKGLSAPLFAQTAANIKNLKLTDINVVETERVVWGAIAIEAHYGTWTNCEVVGSVEINNTTFDGTPATARDVINIGGLAGQAGGVTFEDCVNRVNITIKACGTIPEGSSLNYEIGGIAGIAHSGASFKNADNYGSITADGEMNALLELSGIVGRIVEYSGLTNHVHTFTGCDNYGVISTTENFSSTKQLLMAGMTSQICSYINDFSNNHNHAAVYHTGKCSTLYAAGICGMNIWSPIENCTNNAHVYSDGETGNIHLSGIVGGNPADAITNCHNNVGGKVYLTAKATADIVYAGGISGGTETNKNKRGKITSCNNYATIECAATTGADNADDVYLAGIVSGTIQAEVTGCRNEGAITFTGKVGLDSGDASHIQIGGITAMKTTDGSNGNISDCHNTADLTCNGLARKILVGGIVGDGNYGTISNCTNSGKIEQMADCAVTTNMAGIVADSSWGSIIDCTNSGKVVVSGTSGNSYLGGIATYGLYRDAKIENCTNTAEICVSETGYVSRGWIAGILGHDLSGANANDATKLATITGCSNSGSIYNAGSASNTRLGGIVGTVTKGHVLNSTNSGAIYNSGTVRDLLLMGGIVGGAGAVEGSLSGCKNTGAISLTGTVTSGKNVYAGGLVSYKLWAPMSNCHNEGNITIAGSSTGRLYIAGLVANQQDESGCFTGANATLDNCTNKGSITIGTAAAAKTSSSFHVSGLINYSRGRLTNCVNKAEGDILVQNMTIGGTFVTGGLACYTYATANDSAENKWENNFNHGDITFKDIIGNTAPCIAGLVYNSSYSSTLYTDVTETFTADNRPTWYNCANHGKITVDNLATKVSNNKHARTIIGGVFGTLSNICDVDKVHNYGEVNVKIKATSNVFVAGFVGYWGSTAVTNYTAYIKNCSNTAAITLESVQDASYAGTSSTEGHLVGGILAQTYMDNKDRGQYHVWENVSNSGTVTLKGNTFNDGSYHYAGGISAYHYTYTNFNNCYNTGTVNVEPATNSTIKLLRVGGMAAELRSKNNNTTENHSKITGCVNTGAITIKGVKSTGSLYVAGVVGHPRNGNNAKYTFDGCGNSGAIKLENVTATGTVYTGGIIGYNEVTTTTLVNTNTNIGNITVSGGSIADATAYVGGIVGYTKAPIAGAQAYCDIAAKDLTNVGMIMGIARADATKATNCAVGGTLWSTSKSEEDANGDMAGGIIGGDNFAWNLFLYGADVDEDTATADGCSVLPTKPTVSLPTVQ